MNKYGLNLRAKPSSQLKKLPAKPLAPIAPGFGFDDDDDNDVDKEIARQAAKKKNMKDIEEQHKKALQEDPSVFDYDGVYDQMKVAAVRPLAQDRQERKSKYIETLMDKAKERERQHEIIYERKLQKERSKEDHLFADKDKYVTSAYKRKLAEQAKWEEEERLRELQELKDDVTKKSDISDFYYNLTKNVAFGAKAAESSKQVKREEEAKIDTPAEQISPSTNNSPSKSDNEEVENKAETSSVSDNNLGSSAVDSELNTSTVKGLSEALQPTADQKKQENHKRSEDAVAAAKERFMARKRAKEN